MSFNRPRYTHSYWEALPVGWQEFANPTLTRRNLLSGIAASSVALYAEFANASESTWYDLEFQLSDDQSTLVVLETRVEDSSSTADIDCDVQQQPRNRSVACRWEIPSAAFGPGAFFDMAEPEECEVQSHSPAPERIVYVRNVSYGLRFGKSDIDGQKQTTDKDDKKQQPGYVAFIFTRPHRRWRVAYLTDLWLQAKGGVDAIVSSNEAELRAFLGEPLDASADPDDLGAQSPSAPFEIIEAGRVDRTLEAIFSDLIGASQSDSEMFRVALDRHLVWTVSGVSGSSLAAHESRTKISEFSFAWRRARAEIDAKQDDAPGDHGRTYGGQQESHQTKGEEVIYFSGNAEPGVISLPNALGLVEIGQPNGHHIKLKPDDSCALRLDVIVGAAPTLPRELQVVSALSIGDGVLAIANGTDLIANGIAGTELIFTQTITPVSTLPRVLRSALWGNSAGAGPRLGKSSRVGAKLRGQGEIDSPVGALLVDVPVLYVSAVSADNPSSQIQAANTARTARSVRLPAASRAGTSGGMEFTAYTRSECPIGTAKSDQEKSAKQLTRFFQTANGDRGGAPDATLFVLHDRLLGGKARDNLRRIHIEVTLLATSTALPDTSYSRLTFKHADLRLVYEDGKPIDELSGGEYPRPIASSFVWVGPPVGKDVRRAAFDLSGAKLTCGRDYDLMKLRLRFHNLLLVYEPDPKIRPSQEEARVRIGEDGAVHDDRPILVAEFDPQHVMEEALFRPEPPSLPDVELKAGHKVTVGDTEKSVRTREEILEALQDAVSESQRIEIRDIVKKAKADQESKEPEPHSFSDMVSNFAGLASGLPKDQRIYIGPFALDPDGMAIARGLMQSIGPTAVRVALDNMFVRVKDLTNSDIDSQTGQVKNPLRKDGRLLPTTTHDNMDPSQAFANAIRNEAIFEALEPLYGVFRSFWRDQVVLHRTSLRNGKSKVETESLKFTVPAYSNRGEELKRAFVSEFLSEGNRPSDYPTDTGFDKLLEGLKERFVDFALGREPLQYLQGARLSGRSRLAFRIDCEPGAGIDAREAGVDKSSGDGPMRPGSASSSYSPIPFTFEKLTDWSRFEPSVTKRARKLFEALPSGILPRPGSRSTNASDQAMMRFQGFSEAPTTAEARMAEVRASIKSERISNAENGEDRPFPGEPLDFETAIEIPARMILSTAQDAIWRTNRRMPPEVYTSLTGDPISPGNAVQVELEEGGGLGGPKSISAQPRDLYSVRLETLDWMDIDKRPEAISLRAVSSPDLRPTALGGYRTGDALRLPGHGAPPRGPYAPWFIGPEQTESGTLTAQQAASALGEDSANVCLAPPAKPSKHRLIRWLCERAGFREALPAENYTIFRTSLDAFDRHQLVLLSSVYGLPVVGKRNPAAGSHPEDVETSGGLIAKSGQIEPGESFSLLDATDDQALHKPVPLNVKALSLTALGGSFLHDTSFKPSAGADDIFGRKIFEGFSIDTLQQDIVLGRDIRTEVVYKGYLLPLGHKASFVKLTERIFIRTERQGIKAMLRQRMFLRMAERTKFYGALGQPHSGRMWCAKRVRLSADRTPDILDPTLSLGKTLLGEDLNGRISLGNGPGLVFWPRTDITDSGLYRFEITIDGTPTSLPMLFVDNIAATTSESLKSAVDYYNDANQDALISRRKLHIGGRKIDFAPNSKSGEAQFETSFIRIRAHGRLRTPSTSSWTGELEALENFVTTGILEGAGQPPFYPAMELCEIGLGPVERMNGGEQVSVKVQYDGHYVLYGFDDDPLPRGLPKPELKDRNPKEVFLNLREARTLKMGNNGDRSGGIARPETHIVAISRSKGPLGGDESTWWRTRPGESAPVGEIQQIDGLPKSPPIQDENKITDLKLLSLAAYFNEEVKRPVVKPVPLPKGSQHPFPMPSPETASEVFKQIQSFFSLDAKLLGTIKFKDLMWLLGLNVDSIPILKEVREFGTAAKRELGGQLENVSNDLRSRVLVPLRDAIELLRTEWLKLDSALKAKQLTLPTLDSNQVPKPLTLAEIYPEIDSGLEKVRRALNEALATEDAASLIPKLAEVHSSARELIRALAILASNPVERLEEAITGNLRERISAVTGALENLKDIVGQLEGFKSAFLNAATDAAAATITNWIFEKIAGTVPAGSTVEIEAGNRLLEVFPLGAQPPDLKVTLKSLISDVETSAGALWVQVSATSEVFADKVLAVTRDAMMPMIKAAITEVIKGNADNLQIALTTGVNTYVSAIKQEIKDAKNSAKVELDNFAKSTTEVERNAALALQATLDAYTEHLLDGIIDTVNKKFPDEIQAVVASLERLNVTIINGKKLANAVKGGEPKEILKTSGAFAQEVLGIDVENLKGNFKKVATEKLFDAIKKTAAAILDEEPLRVDPSNAPIILSEVGACAPLKESPPRAASLPVEMDGKVKASNALLLGIGEGIKALNDARDNIPKFKTALTDPVVEKAGLLTQLTGFTDRLSILIEGDGSTVHGLVDELSELYCNIVDVEIAARDLKISLLVGDLDEGSLKQIGTLSKHLRRLGTAISDGLQQIARQLNSFFRDPENQAVLAGGAVIGGAVVYLEKNGIKLSDLAESQFLIEIKTKAATLEKNLVTGLVSVVRFGLRLINTSTMGAGTGIDEIKKGVEELVAVAERVGLSLEPESNALLGSLAAVRKHLDAFASITFETTPSTLAQLQDARLSNNTTINEFFTEVANDAPYRRAEKALRDLEAAVLREWRRFQQRLEGVPDVLKKEVDNSLVGVFAALGKGYKKIADLRIRLLEEASKVQLFAPFARRALLVEPDPRIDTVGSGGCDINDISISNEVLATCDRLAQEVDVLKDAEGLTSNTNDDDRAAVRRRIVAYLRNWGNGQAAPLLIVSQAEEMAKDLLRGDILAAIDLGAFRDQIEDAIAGLIPTKVNFSYDFNSIIDKNSDSQAIFQPKFGSEFGIILRASLDLLSQKSDFSATAHIGPFDIFLIGGVVDALRLKFGGAAFSTRSNSSSRFDVIYEDFEIGKDLEFAQKLQTYLAPKDGSGVFIQPMTRSAGIEAGYGINLGTIGVGATSFFNVTLNVSAELPFGNEESLFKVSLGRRLAPFTMGVFPFVGSGYFAIFAAADGVRGFEAAFEYGGGAAIGYGPLAAQCRIQVGVFVRILKVNGVRKTEIYGTFFAGGSASIWIFSFATSLYVRLGTADGGAMYGEAIYSFSFSLGIADYDYSITAYKKEKSLGSGQQASLDLPRRRPIRFAALQSSSNTLTDATDGFILAAGQSDEADEKSGELPTGFIIVEAADQALNWDRYATYFDVSLVKGMV